MGRASFISFDCEFTGLHRERQQGLSALQSAPARYRTLRATLLGGAPADGRCHSCGSELLEAARFCHSCGAIRRRPRRRRVAVDGTAAAGRPPADSALQEDPTAEEGDVLRVTRRQGYLIAQVGLACFEWDPQRQGYAVTVFCYYLSPRPWAVGGATSNVKVDHDLHFGCLASSLQFLGNHGFDFNRWLHRGVPYLSRKVYATERERLENRGQVMVVRDLDAMRGFLDVWDTLLDSGKPLVGHQCMLDLLYLWHQLEEPLPKDLSVLLKKLAGRIKLAVDTKHLLCGYPEEMAGLLEQRLRDSGAQPPNPDGSTAKDETRSLQAVQDGAMRELLRLLRPQGQVVDSAGVKSLHLAELYHLLAPLAAGEVPVLDGENSRAHDAGHDAFMTGVVFAAVYRLLHGADAEPGVQTLMATHSAGSTEHGPAARLKFANRLHVFAAPYCLDVSAPPPDFGDTHNATVVVQVTQDGAVIDVSRLAETVRSVSRTGEVYWVEWPRIAVVALSPARRADDAAAAAAVERLCALCRRHGWQSERAEDWLRRHHMFGHYGASRRQRGGSARVYRMQLLKAARERRRKAATAQRQQAAQAERMRQQEIAMLRQVAEQDRQMRQQADAQMLVMRQELTGLREAKQTLEQRSAQSMEAAAAGEKDAAALREAQMIWDAERGRLIQDREALEVRCDGFQKAMDSYRQRAETMRAQLSEERAEKEKAQRIAEKRDSKAEALDREMQGKVRKLTRELHSTREALQQLQAQQEKEAKEHQAALLELAKAELERKHGPAAADDAARAAGSGSSASGAGAEAAEEEAARQAEGAAAAVPTTASAPAAPDPVPGDPLDRIRKQRRAAATSGEGAARRAASATSSWGGGRSDSGAATASVQRAWHEQGEPGDRAKQRRMRAEEVRPGQWQIERKGATDARGLKEGEVSPKLLHIDPQSGRAQVLEVRECRHLKIFLSGLLGSASFTDCEHVTVYCENAVTDGRPWTGRHSGQRVFIYGGDKSTCQVQIVPQREWPTMRGAELVISRQGQTPPGRGVPMGQNGDQQKLERDIIRIFLMTIFMMLILLKLAPQPELRTPRDPRLSLSIDPPPGGTGRAGQ